MQVLEKGQQDRAFPVQIRCGNCTALLAVEVADCYLRVSMGKKWRRETVYFTCPECLHEQTSVALHGIRDMVPTATEFFKKRKSANAK